MDQLSKYRLTLDELVVGRTYYWISCCGVYRINPEFCGMSRYGQVKLFWPSFRNTNFWYLENLGIGVDCFTATFLARSLEEAEEITSLDEYVEWYNG